MTKRKCHAKCSEDFGKYSFPLRLQIKYNRTSRVAKLKLTRPQLQVSTANTELEKIRSLEEVAILRS